MTIIQDPVKGTGAKVNDQQQFETFATAQPVQTYANLNRKNAFTMDLDNVVIDGDTYIIAAIKNADDEELVITSITMWVATAKSDGWLEAYVGGTYTNDSNGTVVTPTNLHAGSGIAPSSSSLFIKNDGAGNITTVSGASVAGRWLPSAAAGKWEKSTGWVIPKNGVFYITGAKDNTYRGYISFYLHTFDTSV